MYDCIVIGAGHAGCEAALACARMNKKTLLITGNLNMTGSMPCNPSIGGPAKGVVVREIDALGGEMARNADKTQIQVKMLNSSKGPAVRALRFQSDKRLYPREMLKTLQNQENLDLKEGYVEKFLVENNTVKGVLFENEKIESKAVVITTGTYMRSRILRGHNYKEEGPDSQKTSRGISDELKELGFEVIRLKTGTPARIYTDSIDFSKGSVEYGDKEKLYFSFDKIDYNRPQVPCCLIYTNEVTKQIILENLDKSAMYGGVVEGVGPRYCPSIEDKIVRFKDKERHQIFLEPESLELNETYVQGFSTSMPEDVQDRMIRTLPGLENCRVKRYAYAIEYDAINPMQLKPTLESKLIDGLYFAGQVNGTSGYEEAACQGLMAGINVSLKLDNKEPLILKRNEAYIGVLIDDLITKGIRDPYRLLTSRAEYRLLLRNDNADERLMEYGHKVGLLREEKYQKYLEKRSNIDKYMEYLKASKIAPKKANPYLKEHEKIELNETVSGYELLKRPEIDYNDVITLFNLEIDPEIIEAIEITAKYSGYIAKANEQAKKMLEAENIRIPDDFDYDGIRNLASEAKEKLKKIKPLTIGQAMRISGVNPADITQLLFALKR
ncbi:MAG: tRNA uridine-5-carboxymethylaminomethyl(34) synthesis enzyme MnmG [Acholeplasmatales bacterium]|nr:tRNA uridine-5-carboxymethylaminomethyl(34) synthesis enzyme MnmG [Acholeplasmatales bacterium]